MLRILLCDDHKIMRDGVSQILKQSLNEVEISEAACGNDALEVLKNKDIELLVLDISLPGIGGLEVLRIVKDRYPTTNVLMLSMLPQEQYAIRALKLGASGYLTKDTASEELVMAVKKVHRGGRYISVSLAENMANYIDNRSILQKHENLSSREFEIMLKLADGKSLLEIGNELYISDKTVSTYRSRIMEKMEMSRNTDLTKYCIKKSLI